MSEGETRAAIAAQEEHIRRSTSCRGVLGSSHAFRVFGMPGTDSAWSQCIACDVTETPADYAVKTATR
jgi:hypothetical protein